MQEVWAQQGMADENYYIQEALLDTKEVLGEIAG